MANSIGPGQMPHSVASDLGLHCLQSLSVPILRVIMIISVNFYLHSCMPSPDKSAL